MTSKCSKHAIHVTGKKTTNIHTCNECKKEEEEGDICANPPLSHLAYGPEVFLIVAVERIFLSYSIQILDLSCHES